VEKAKMIAAKIKKTLGDCRADLGTKLSWSMKTVATLIHNDPDSRIKKSKSVLMRFTLELKMKDDRAQITG
jgi:hypothetical protein